MTKITPILMAGGSGTRLWPVSRKSFPKQFAPLVGDETLFQASARRLSRLTTRPLRPPLCDSGHSRARNVKSLGTHVLPGGARRPAQWGKCAERSDSDHTGTPQSPTHRPDNEETRRDR